MDAHKIWAEKTDEEIIAAAEQLHNYTEESVRIIRTELVWRGLPAAVAPETIERLRSADRTVAAIAEKEPLRPNATHTAEFEASMVFDSEGIAADVRDRRSGAIDLFGDFDHSRIDSRCTGLEARFIGTDQGFRAIDKRFAALDQRFAALDERFDTLGDEMSRQCRWIVGIQITMFLALAGMMIARFFALW